MTLRILVVDDLYATSGKHRGHLDGLLASLGVAATYSAGQRRDNGQAVNDVQVALDAAGADAGSPWSLALVDMHFASGTLSDAGVPRGKPGDEDFGSEIEAALNARFPDLPTVRFTDRHEGEIAGARRPFLSKHLVTSTEIAATLVRYGRMPTTSRRVLLGIPKDTVFESSAMFSLYVDAQLAARHEGPILLLGESGTGKEHLARYVHLQSSRANAPFVGINIASVPQDLIEAELFGAERGAYTGATSSRSGFLEAAGSGTLFLDEIGDLPAHAQSKLLRVLQENEYYSVGSRISKKLTCGVVAATRQPIEQRVHEGVFREDLYYRFSRVLRIPPLRQRKEDIVPLAIHILGELSQASGKEGVHFSEEALHAIEDDSLLGNVRELTNLIGRALSSSSHRGLIRWMDLRPNETPAGSISNRQSGDGKQSPLLSESVSEKNSDTLAGTAGLSESIKLLSRAQAPLDAQALRGMLTDLDNSTGHIRRQLALAALASCRHPMSGKLRVLPAMQLLTGDPGLTATNARRRLNDLLGFPQSSPLDTVRLGAEVDAFCKSNGRQQ